ncbi:DUF58 domain-containing protein [Zhihengliuella alba]|uniref:DUF58 domain-containing protein n=1 Tax=Zhihengliuella alba TaxID=547018 RepID=A0ABP7DBU7_9MICC
MIAPLKGRLQAIRRRASGARDGGAGGGARSGDGSRDAMQAAARERARAARGALRQAHTRSVSALKEGNDVVRDYAHPYVERYAPRVRRVVEPLRDLVSPLGAVVAATAVLLWVLGVVFGWFEAVLGGVMAVLLLLLAVAFILGRAEFRVELDVARTRVAVGDRAVGAMTVVNAGRTSSSPVSMEMPVGRSVAEFAIPRLAPAAEHEELFTIPTRRRAVLPLGPVRSVREDPFGLLRRQVRWTEERELFVHPRTTKLDGASAGFIRDLEGMPTKDLSPSDVSFHALREYAPGDDLRHVHWRSTARVGKLMVRQFEETRRSHVAMALSLHLDEYGRDADAAAEDFELAVSVTGSIGLQTKADERKLSVMTQAGPVRTETARQLLDGLTRLEARATGRRGIVEVSRATADAVPNASIMFVITGASVTARQLRQASMHVPAGVRAIALRCGLGLEPARNTIGDLTVLTIGSLDELGLVMRKAMT